MLVRTMILAVALPCTGLIAQNPAAPTTPPRCDRPEHRQLDFWVGEWDVSISQGHAGTSSVTLEEDGCVVHEHWKADRGETGQSLNFFDRNDRKWHQVWISNRGGALNLAGASIGGAIVYTGETRRPGGPRTLHRLSFAPDSAGNVRQFWEVSQDGGAKWAVTWDALYRKKPTS
ncbi:MAG: hypothetical protein H0U85_06865 [Gemmatimonadales bacterium]|nr:hypothetical protein [Gemmatimonadales bacterium]